MGKQQKRQHDFLIKEREEPLYSDLSRIFSVNNLREVLTHSSFYGKEDKGNSRYVFAGMFVFKGMVADVLYRYAPGDGTQLQHILGNLFRNERLIRLFDEWELENYVRAGEKFDIDAHKHIFVYAIFGYVTTLDENLRNWFIAKYILNEGSDYLFVHKRRNRDLLAQADALAKQTNGQHLSLVMAMTDDGLHCAKAILSDGTVLCEATSKTALNLLATPFRKELLSDPEYQARKAAREEEKQAKRKAEIEARDAAKEAQRAERLKARKEEARLRDAKRRKAQAEAKKRKAEHAARAAAKAAKETQPMSAKK